MSTLATEMREAWAEIARGSLDTLRAAEQAPALFHPEVVKATAETYVTALRHMNQWVTR